MTSSLKQLRNHANVDEFEKQIEGTTCVQNLKFAFIHMKTSDFHKSSKKSSKPGLHDNVIFNIITSTLMCLQILNIYTENYYCGKF